MLSERHKTKEGWGKINQKEKVKSSFSGGVQERDEELVLSHMLVFPSQTSEAIPWDGDKKGPVL